MMKAQSADAASDIKRKVRKLKRFELTVRFGGEADPCARLVFDRFFDLHEPPRGGAKYTLRELAAMDRDAYRQALDAYFASVYYALYQERGMTAIIAYDPAALEQLGLSPYADEAEIKKRFRELAKRYHPDAGGDEARFIALMKLYERLTGKSTGA